MRGFRPSRLSGDSEEHQRLMACFRQSKVHEYRRRIASGEGIFERAPRRRPVRGMEEMMRQIRYRCQRCNTLLESPESLVGQADVCPVCGQRCTVPDTSRKAQKSSQASSKAGNMQKHAKLPKPDHPQDKHIKIDLWPAEFDEIPAGGEGTDIDDEIDLSVFDPAAVMASAGLSDTQELNGSVEEQASPGRKTAFEIDGADALKTFCEHCRNVIAVPVELKHKKTSCPECGQRIRVRKIAWTADDEAAFKDLIDEFTTASYGGGDKARAIELQHELKKLSEKKEAAGLGGSQDSLW